MLPNVFGLQRRISKRTAGGESGTLQIFASKGCSEQNGLANRWISALGAEKRRGGEKKKVPRVPRGRIRLTNVEVCLCQASYEEVSK